MNGTNVTNKSLEIIYKRIRRDYDNKKKSISFGLNDQFIDLDVELDFPEGI